MVVLGRLRGRGATRKRRTVNGRRVLVTGAASGIGRATAQAVAQRGGRLILTDIDEAGLAATVRDVEASGGVVDFSRALDISQYDDVAAFAGDVHAAHGAVDVVMNVAGISAWGTVETMPHEQWRQLVEVNLMGPIHVIQTFVPAMIAAGRGGYLVNVSSSAGLLAFPWHAAYSASKFGLRGVSEVLRFDLARHGIGVSLVVPGAVRTPLVETVRIAGVDRADPKVRRLEDHFHDRAAEPQDVALAILRGMERGHFLVYSGNDIRFTFWVQRKFALPYEIAMQAANDYFTRLLK